MNNYARSAYLLALILCANVCFAEDGAEPSQAYGNEVKASTQTTDWADAHAHVQQALSGKVGQTREDLLWTMMADSDPLVSEAAAQELIVEPTMAVRLFNSENLPLDAEAQEIAKESFLKLGPLAIKTLLPDLKTDVRDHILQEYAKKHEDGSSPRAPTNWSLIKTDKELFFFTTPPSHVVSYNECVGMELWIRRGRQWLSFGTSPSFTLTKSLYWEGCLSSRGRGYKLWQEKGAQSYLLFASPQEYSGTLYRLTPGKIRVMTQSLGNFSAPVAYLDGQVLHSVQGTSDLWSFDPMSKTDRLLLKGPEADPYSSGLDDGNADYIPPRLADLSQVKNGAMFSGLNLVNLNPLPIPLPSPTSLESSGLLVKAKQKIVSLLDTETTQSVAEAVTASKSAEWEHKVMPANSTELLWRGKLKNGSDATVIVQGRAMGLPQQGIKNSVFFVDCLDVAMQNKSDTSWSRCKTKSADEATVEGDEQ